MVMAQFPNTQYVAHEFVRQYYTMLHKDPTQLHRFYTKESRLTHGGSPNSKSEDPVCGQEAIYEKISQLNFRNCYAKIRSVDSHPTIGGGVVIQVTGELSNSGMAMRKFMQTFVLAQQDPKKYNVFNDIFRYQDETFEDTENDETADGTVESENGYQNHEPAPVDHMDTIPDIENEVLAEPAVDASSTVPLLNDEQFRYSNYITPDQTEEEEEQEVEEEEAEVEDEEEEKETEGDHEDIATHEHDALEEPCDQKEPVENSEAKQQEETEFEVLIETPEEAPEQEVPQDTSNSEEKEDDGTEFKEFDSVEIETNEPTAEKVAEQPVEPEVEEPAKPFTWAALAKKNTPVTSNPPPTASKAPVKKPTPAQQRPAPVNREATPPKRDAPEESRRRAGPPPDSHQIFIGNLPSGITEKEIKDAFKDFGTIVEVRLNPKNFGFIAFAGPDAPTKILNKTKPIVIQNHTINTEVKRSVGGGGRGGGGGGGGGGFRRGDKDSSRGRNEFNKSSNRNTGGQSRPGKSSTFGQKQPRNTEDGKNDKNREQKTPREQRQPRR